MNIEFFVPGASAFSAASSILPMISKVGERPDICRARLGGAHLGAVERGRQAGGQVARRLPVHYPNALLPGLEVGEVQHCQLALLEQVELRAQRQV